MKEPLYKVGIIGLGVVGQGVEKLLKEYVVATYTLGDNLKEKMEKFKGLDLAVIAVPTPTSDDGMSCDTSEVDKTLSWLTEIDFKGVVLIKSTVIPSRLKEYANSPLRIVFSPEYMGESKYFTPPWKYPDPKNMESHTWQTFGGDKKDTELCVEIFKRKMGVDTHFYQTDIVTAGLAKYIENCFFAMKVIFVNEWYDIAQAFGVDWNELREMWLADPRINRNHTLVFPRDRGYAGKCFPKDVKAIIADSEKMGHLPNLMLSVDTINEVLRKLNERKS